jgi:REP element-mobilizing transposase RayT
MNQQLRLNEIGRMILQEWLELEASFSQMQHHDFIVMPDHLHALLEIKGENLKPEESTETKEDLSKIIKSFKGRTTSFYGKGVKQKGWPPYQKKLWQRSFHERIVRNLGEYQKYSQYIIENPANWNTHP